MISGRGGGASRAGRIRPPRRNIRLAPNGENNQYETHWSLIREALNDIHVQNCSRLSFEELYRASYKIVLIKAGPRLYEDVKGFEEKWFREHVVPVIEALVTASLISVGVDRNAGSSTNERRQAGEKFLQGIRDAWESHNISMNMTADMLMYLDRGFADMEGAVPIFQACIAQFRDHILKKTTSNTDHTISDIVLSVMIDQLDMEREGDVIDRSLIKSCSRMLTGLYETAEEVRSEALYLTVFEPEFLRNSTKFYAAECEKLLRDADASTWLRHTERRLNEERDRCGTAIEHETLPRVQKVIDQELILRHLPEFLALEGSGLVWMLDNDKIDDLKILYNLIARVDDTKAALRDMVQNRVLDLGREIETALQEVDFSKSTEEGGEKKPLGQAAQQTAAAIKWVDDVLALKSKFDRFATECFNKDVVMISALTKSFSDFINQFNRSSEYVSLFIDDTLKRGIKGKTEAEVDQILEKAITLVQYLLDRDMFETYYQRHLARRLLHDKSESHDVEKQIISRMKQELGQQFTSKFEGMFRDLAMSAELTSGYRDHVASSTDGSKKVDLAVNVLASNFWPGEIMGRTANMGDNSRMTCNYPPEIQRVQKSFEQYYLSNRSGRKLTWIGTTGSADVKCVFPAIEGKAGVLAKERRHEINMPTFAMVVLMLFNDLEDDETLTYQEIQERTEINHSDLQRALTAIAVAPKSRVLTKEPATKSIKPDDKFSFNASFQSKAMRIKAPIINAVSKVEDNQERKKTEERNLQQRSYMVDAAIVRIMKSRKELGHSQLVSETIAQMTGKFKPDVGLIKKRIEDLIAREYLERPEGKFNEYTYVA